MLDYVVFERHVSDEYGTWRLHGKVSHPNSTANYTYIPTQRLFSVNSSTTSESNKLIANSRNNIDDPISVNSSNKDSVN